MQAGLKACAFKGVDHGDAASGGLNLSGGDLAKGNPRYTFAETASDGWLAGFAVVPIIVPAEMVTVGCTAVGAAMIVEDKMRNVNKDSIEECIIVSIITLLENTKKMLLATLDTKLYLYRCWPYLFSRITPHRV